MNRWCRWHWPPDEERRWPLRRWGERKELEAFCGHGSYFMIFTHGNYLFFFLRYNTRKCIWNRNFLMMSIIVLLLYWAMHWAVQIGFGAQTGWNILHEGYLHEVIQFLWIGSIRTASRNFFKVEVLLDSGLELQKNFTLVCWAYIGWSHPSTAIHKTCALCGPEGLNATPNPRVRRNYGNFSILTKNHVTTLSFLFWQECSSCEKSWAPVEHTVLPICSMVLQSADNNCVGDI